MSTVRSTTGPRARLAEPIEAPLNDDSRVDETDITVWVKDLFNSWIGDANVDGEFTSSDLIDVLASGTYNTGVDSVWSSGDFNGDGQTTTSDLVVALADGGFGAGPRTPIPAVPEPSTAALAGLACGVMVLRQRSRRS